MRYAARMAFPSAGSKGGLGRCVPMFLTRSGALSPDRIMGVETGGCPHTAIREDASINIDAVERMLDRFPDLDLLHLWRAAVTIWRRPSVRSWLMCRFTSSMCREVIKFLARGVQGSLAPTYW